MRRFFCFMRTAAPPLRPHNIGTRASPKPGTHLNVSKCRVDRMHGCRTADTSAVKKKHEWIPMAGEEKWMENTKIWKAKRKAMDTNTGGKSLETHLLRKWRDIGHLRALSPWSNGWMDLTVQNVHPPKPMMHIAYPPISTKFINFPLLPQNL